jgi:cell filamentation protein
VLRNLLGIARVRAMNLAESQALEIAQDLGDVHALWLGPIYPWAGAYRSVDIGKGGFHHERTG